MPRFAPHARSAGFLVVFVAAALAAAAAVFIAKSLSDSTNKSLNQSTVTLSQMTGARQAVTDFIKVNGYVPCPAQPTLAPSDANYGLANGGTAGPVTDCTYDAGILPFRTLGLTAEQATDEWGGMISFRVYDLGTGVTRTGGLDMSLCSSTATATTPTATNCASDNSTSTTQFIADKGLAVPNANLANSTGGAAFVLISHGPNKLGGYTPNGVARTAPTNAREITNNGSAGSYEFENATPTTVQSTTFDDIVVPVSITQAASYAGRSARAWSVPGVTVTSGGGTTTISASAATATTVATPSLTSGTSIGGGVTVGSYNNGTITSTAIQINGVPAFGVSAGSGDTNGEVNNNDRLVFRFPSSGFPIAPTRITNLQINGASNWQFTIKIYTSDTDANIPGGTGAAFTYGSYRFSATGQGSPIDAVIGASGGCGVSCVDLNATWNLPNSSFRAIVFEGNNNNGNANAVMSLSVQ